MAETKKSKPKLAVFGSVQNLIAALVIVAVSAGLVSLPVKELERLHGWDIDGLHQLRQWVLPEQRSSAESPTVVVAIDESTYLSETLIGIPKVIWTPHIGKVQDAVLAGGAKVFGWDIVIPTSAATFVADKRYDKPLLVSLLKNGRKAGRILLGHVEYDDTEERILRPDKAFRTAVGRNNVFSLRAHVDEDRTLRGVPLFLPTAGETESEIIYAPSMSMELASRGLGITPERLDNGEIILGDYKIPHGEEDNLTVKFDGNEGAIPTYALADLLACVQAGNTEYFRNHFSDKIVVFGLVSDIEDRKTLSNRFIVHGDMVGAPAPCTNEYEYITSEPRSAQPGVYLHATAVNNLIERNALARPSTTTQILSVVLIAGIMVMVAMKYRPQISTLIGVGVGLIWVAIATVSFDATFILPLADPLIAGFLSNMGVIGYKYVTTDKQRALIHKSFELYLDPNVIDEMIESGDVPKLGGESRELTCFFSDIASFSKISEKMDSHELVEFLNIYFSIIGKHIKEHNGIIERFIGDAVIAIFGAPKPDQNHAYNCVACTMAIQKDLVEAQEQFKIPGGMEVVTRVGVNSGMMTVGNVGAEGRISYTAMGDAMNLAARLESGGKQFGSTLMVGDNTWDQCKDRFEWRILDRVRVVGRAQPVTLREPLGRSGEVDRKILDNRDRFEVALDLRTQRKFKEALAEYQAMATNGDAGAASAADRVQLMIDNPPPEDWDGVLDLTSK